MKHQLLCSTRLQSHASAKEDTQKREGSLENGGTCEADTHNS